MAALTSAAVSLYPGITPSATVSRPSEWYVGSKGSGIIGRSLALVLTGQGGTLNTINASALGFATIVSCTNLYDAEHGVVYPTVADPTTNTILVFSTDTQAIYDVTSTISYITVTGSVAAAHA
jgi:hypothetical protein